MQAACICARQREGFFCFAERVGRKEEYFCTTVFFHHCLRPSGMCASPEGISEDSLCSKSLEKIDITLPLVNVFFFFQLFLAPGMHGGACMCVFQLWLVILHSPLQQAICVTVWSLSPCNAHSCQSPQIARLGKNWH